jgi:xanthine dehydrogenase YagT iron-sulfur-binding subunit
MPRSSDPRDPKRGGVSRRGFIGSLGAGAATAAAIGAGGAQSAEASVAAAGALAPVTLLINGRKHGLMVEPRWTLAFILREKLGLTGTKTGCERGECGACTVLIDGKARYSCLTLALEAEGHQITTIEGLMKGEELGDVQKAFAEEDAFQCGYCTPGQMLAAEGLLGANPNPSVEEIRLGMSGNLCRCGAYAHIVRAVKHAAETRRTAGGAR